ncbi:hypothetical protein [Microbacterium sp.]|uniref:hypothetical protein n=1 Tax=Microbacterium sp. TaxID=51671 RepID=UPI002BE74443|nr:hypothetical protein [Microbacterium sp.]HWL78112.1 hypothetical protein [Microbacterium sp.]
MASDSAAYRGVHLQRGSRLRIAELTISLDGGQHTLRLQVQWDMFAAWLDIAERARDAAVAARAANPGPDHPEEFTTSLDEELRYAMTSICASAFALEAFSNSVRVHLPETPQLPDGAARRVRHVLHTGFDLPNETAKSLRAPFAMIFRLRNDAVHPPAGFVDPIRHPDFPLSIEPSYVKFREENARNALQVARDIITFALARPRRKYPELARWAESALNNLNGQTTTEAATPPPGSDVASAI